MAAKKNKKPDNEERQPPPTPPRVPTEVRTARLALLGTVIVAVASLIGALVPACREIAQLEQTVVECQQDVEKHKAETKKWKDALERLRDHKKDLEGK